MQEQGQSKALELRLSGASVALALPDTDIDTGMEKMHTVALERRWSCLPLARSILSCAHVLRESGAAEDNAQSCLPRMSPLSPRRAREPCEAPEEDTELTGGHGA